VIGERNPPRATGAIIQRLEIPYGRFERRILLPAGRYGMARREILNGCVVLWLHRLD
jgi:hypothetical protein